VEEENQII